MIMMAENGNSSTASFKNLEELCSRLVTKEEHTTSFETRNKPSNLIVWTAGIGFVTLIGMCAVTGIILMRFLKKSSYSRFITFFVSVGVGSLSGSAVFHLLPQAFGLVDEFNQNSTNEYLNKSFAILIGIYLFFFTDKAIKLCLEIRKKSKHLTKYNKSYNGGRKVETYLMSNLDQSKTSAPDNTKVGSIVDERTPEVFEVSDGIKEEYMDEYMNRQAHSICVHDHDLSYKQGDSVVATVAWMIIFGDGLHNFIDGISIGASFAESIVGGVSVSVAVLCEEFPHELGDVAILINAGMNVKQALLYNVLSALSCYVGFAIGVLAGNVNEVFASYTFGFAGGMFLYISMSCMMPEMKTAMEKALDHSTRSGIEVLGLQASGVIIGAVIMAAMARFGNSIKF